MVAVNLHINEVVDNFLFLLVLKFQGHRPFWFKSYSYSKLEVGNACSLELSGQIRKIASFELVND
jgi:hypothetical protein